MVKVASAAAALCLAGCTAAYRSVHVRDARVDALYLLGAHWESEEPRSPHVYGELKLGALGTGSVPSRKVPGGIDKWSGALIELEVGHRWPLWDTGTGALVAGLGAQVDFWRFVEHLANASGAHDHSDDGDFHRDYVKWGGGIVTHVGFVQRLSAIVGQTIEPKLSLGLTSIDDFGPGWFIEAGLSVSW